MTGIIIVVLFIVVVVLSSKLRKASEQLERAHRTIDLYANTVHPYGGAPADELEGELE
jgi:uncharacterized protein YoxC